MPDHNDEQLRNALRDLHDAALPHITPPGLPHLHRKVRRRVVARTSLVAVLGVLVLSLCAIVPNRDSPPPIQPTPTPSGSTSVRPTPSPSASANPEAAVGASSCDDRPMPVVVDGFQAWGKTVTFRLAGRDTGLICAEVRTRVTWVTYEHISGGLQRVYASETFVLTPGQQHTTVIRYNPSCRGDLHYLMGDIAVLPTIPAVTTTAPYPWAYHNNWVYGWFDGYGSGPQYCQVLADASPTPTPSESEPPPP